MLETRVATLEELFAWLAGDGSASYPYNQASLIDLSRKVGELESKINRLSGRSYNQPSLSDLSRRLDNLESKVSDISRSLSDISSMKSMISALERKVSSLEYKVK